MQPQPRAYLASLRRELLGLAATLDPATAGGLSYCVNQIVSQLIARDEAVEPLTNALETAIYIAANEAGVQFAPVFASSAVERRTILLQQLEIVYLALPNNAMARKALEKAASRADDAFRKSFTAAAAQVTDELKSAPQSSGWTLSAERVEQVLAKLSADWQDAKVIQLKPLAGLHAKEIYFLDLQLASGEVQRLVVRCDREADVTRASVADEFPLLRALYDRGFIIPEPLVVVKSPDVLGQPALLMRRVGGIEKTLETLTHPQKTIADAAQFLARLHTTSIEGTGLDDSVGSDGVIGMWKRRIAGQYDWWREMAVEPAPVMWRARRWLEDNVHLVADAATVVHGDFSLRNLLLNDDDSLSSVLDWELAHVGHPAEDLGYMRLTIDSIMPWAQFDAMYRAAGGGKVTREQIAYFDVWGLYRNLAINATVQNFFLNGRTTDYFLATAAITYYPGLLSQLTEALERVD